ncbi:MAG TPA: CDGSH iron-sulfur domain-containing protein [Anaerolineales bacterium]|nr:CDGSH iron-sulfur domain-containing protein [Anaerolineales bacterium]
MEIECKSNNGKQIEICCGGPYIVIGGIPLVSKIQVVSEYGEPLTWNKEGEIPTPGEGYFLCRCGQSAEMPFCDGTHAKIQFEGTETAPVNSTRERRETYPGCRKILIHMDANLCTAAGFCANRTTSIAEMAMHTDDTQVRALAIAMIEHCPSGALTYALNDGGDDVEVDLPEQIAVTNEIVSEGIIRGPLWVTGGIRIIRSDGQPYESRNRVTLCNCGRSQNKPLCDGSHRDPH